MNMPKQQIKCACVHPDAYECARILDSRHPNPDSKNDDAYPRCECECVCHDNTKVEELA